MAQLLQLVFADVGRAYTANEPIALPSSGCEGNRTCIVSMHGPGLDIACEESYVPYGYHGLLVITPENNNITAFEVEVGEFENVTTLSTVNFTATYKPDPSCDGSFVKKRCFTRLATVRIP